MGRSDKRGGERGGETGDERRERRRKKPIRGDVGFGVDRDEAEEAKGEETYFA